VISSYTGATGAEIVVAPFRPTQIVLEHAVVAESSVAEQSSVGARETSKKAQAVMEALFAVEVNALEPAEAPQQVVKTPTPTPTLTPPPTATRRPTATPTTAPTATPLPLQAQDALVDMATIRATVFSMGASASSLLEECNLFRTGCIEEWFSASAPVHKVELDPYRIDLYEVSNEKYVEFLNQADDPLAACGGNECLSLDDSEIELTAAGDYTVAEEVRLHPVAGVAWYGAKAFCEWRVARLPTEAEWELAASWNIENETKSVYPWGDQFDGTLVNFCDANCTEQQAISEFNDGFAATSPVGSFPDGRSPNGAYDMAGNLWEWVNDWYDPTYFNDSPRVNPKGPDSGDTKVVRGGSWFDTGNFTATTIRFPAPPEEAGDSIGFRCAMDVLDKAEFMSLLPATLTPTPTNTVPPTRTPRPTNTATSTPTATATSTATNTPRSTNTPRPTNTPLPTDTPVPTNTPLPTDTAVPTNTPEPTNTATPEPAATPIPTNTPEPTATKAPTRTPSPAPTATEAPAEVPEAAPTEEPAATAVPDEAVTATPEAAATAEPTKKATPPPAPVSFNCSANPGEIHGTTYTVGACESLYKIARITGFSFEALLDANPQLKRRPELIYMGQILNLPGAVTVSRTAPLPAGPPVPPVANTVAPPVRPPSYTGVPGLGAPPSSGPADEIVPNSGAPASPGGSSLRP
jgi:formylglycine-generating enzyme required for sulfatase activity/LysM repeat protein